MQRGKLGFREVCWRCWAAFDTAKADELTARVMERLLTRAPELVREILKEDGLDQKITELARGEKVDGE